MVRRALDALEPSRMTRHRLPLSIATAAVVLAAGGGWIAALQIRSPAELAARAEPPEPSLITVPLERLRLTADVVVRGDVVYEEPATIAFTGSLGPEIEATIVTSVPRVGTEISEGDVVLEVAGRPILVLAGEVPTYRALRPGSRGPDVRQLEDALVRLRYLAAQPDDVWDAATSAAITAWYQHVGYEPTQASESDLAALAAATERHRLAEVALVEAEEALAEARKGPPESAILAARSNVTTAEEQLEATKRAAASAMGQAEAQLRAAADASEAASAQLKGAETRLAAAESGTHPDTGLPPTDEELEQLRRELDEARINVEAAQRAVAEAEEGLIEVTAQNESLVRQASDSVAIAKAQLKETLTPPDTASQRRQVEAVRTEIAQAQEDLHALEARTGPWIPAGELVFIRRLPARVADMAVEVGDQLAGEAVTLATSDVTVRVSLPARDATLIDVGSEVRIEHASLESDLSGVISFISDRPGTDGAPADAVYAEVTASDISEQSVGLNVKVTIPIESTAYEVFAVPAAALTVTSSGVTQIQVLDGDLVRTLEVQPGLAAGGLVEITLLGNERLDVGMPIVIGRAIGT